MKNLLILTGFITGAFFTLLSVGKYISFEPSIEKEERGINDAMSWWYNVRSNQQTGMFDVSAILAAEKQADEMSSTRNLGIQWEEMGPDNIGGRTRAVLYDRNNEGVIFAGGVSGGLWKSVNGGDSWQVVNDMFEALTVTCLTQASSGDIYFGTGEALYSFGLDNPTGFSAFGFPGKGIWKSSDGGNTFTHLTSTIPATGNSTTEAWAYVTRLAASIDDPNRIYAAMNSGLKISTDGGASWFDAIGTPLIYAWDVKIGSDGYVHAVVNNKYYRSTTPNGDTFELRSGLGGFPSSTVPLGRIELGIAPSNSNFIYAVCVNSSQTLYGIYKSVDAGLNWILIGPGGSTIFDPLGSFQGIYNVCLGVLPDNEDVVYLGGQLSVWRYSSTLSWYTVSNWLGDLFDLSLYVHADQHTIVFNPFNVHEMIVGCDGGLFRTTNANATYPIFSDLNRNYNVTQFYSASAANTGEVLGGTQDNGTLYIDFLGNTVKSGREVQGGDGGNTEISKLNPNALFAELPAGTITRSSNEGGSFSTFYDNRIDANSDGTIDEGADWLAPFDLWEASDTSRSYFALGAGPVGGTTGHVWFTKGALDFAITPDWFRFPQTDGVVTCVTISNDGNNIYAGTDNGTVYRYTNILAVDDSGKFTYPSTSSLATAWSAVDSGIAVASFNVGIGRYLRWIAVDPTNPNNIVVTAARYGSASYVWHSTNALDSAITFTDITENLPLMPVWTALIDANNPNRLLIGTDLGIYSRDFSNFEGWSEDNTGMARVPVMTIKQEPYYGASYLYIGTYGRGIFRSGSLMVGTDETPIASNNITVFPNPVQHQATLSIMLERGSPLDIKIYALNGSLVQQIHEDNVSAGINAMSVNTSSLKSGTYLIHVKAGTSSFSQKMVVVN